MDKAINKIFILKKPVLLMIVGVAGTGKTTLAKTISKHLHNSALLSKDTIQDVFTIDRDGPLYDDLRLKTYDIQLRFADEQLSLGNSPIIEGPFSKNHRIKDRYTNWPKIFERVAKKYGADLVIVQCRTPTNEELFKRIKKRNFLRDQKKIREWDKWLKYEPQDFPISSGKLFVLYSNESPDLLAKKVLSMFLKARMN